MVDNDNNQAPLSDFLDVLYETAVSTEILPGLISEANNILEEAINNPNAFEYDSDNPLRADQSSDQNASHALKSAPLSTSTTVTDYDETHSGELIKNALASLKPMATHFKRAKALYDKFHAIHDQFLFSKQLINYLPTGVFLVNKELKVLFLNDAAKQYCEANNALHIQNGNLKATDTKNHQLLVEYITQSLREYDSPEPTYLSLKSNSYELCLMADQNKMSVISTDTSADIIALFMISPSRTLHNIGPLLSSLFNLSPAECRLSVNLVTGHSLDEAAQMIGVTKHTVRAQLNSIYVKTSTNSQGKLVSKILSTPLIHRKEHDTTTLTSKHKKNQSDAATHLRTMRLNDNRTMAYAEYGDSLGQPVFLFHRNYGGRLQRHPDDCIAKQYGVRLIVPDRPGVGRSDINPQHSFLTWISDFIQLADYLGIKSFSIIGNSTGACYALACAYKFPNLINTVLLINAPAPFKSFTEIKDMAPTELLLTALARYSPWLLNTVFKSKFRKVADDPQIYLDKVMNSLGADDQAIFGNQSFKDNFLLSAKESVSKTTFGLTRDFVLLSRDWGFDIGRISKPIHCWYGTQGNIIPNKMAIRLIKTLPYSMPRFISHAGHHMLYSNWELILKKCIAN